MDLILQNKYQQAMQQLSAMTDAAFQRSAELVIANQRIMQLEAQLKEKEDAKQSSEFSDRVVQPIRDDNESGRGDQAKAA